MGKVIRLTESDLIRLVKSVINEESTDINSSNNIQERLYTFLEGVIKMSSATGQGWKPTKGNGVKLIKNMLGNYFDKYTRDLYGFKVGVNEPLSWDLYPLTNTKAEGVKCYISQMGNSYYIHLESGSPLNIKNEWNLTTRGSVEEAFKKMQLIYRFYQNQMNQKR